MHIHTHIIIYTYLPPSLKHVEAWKNAKGCLAGFYSLLRGHPPVTSRTTDCTTPTPGGPWAAMAHPRGSPRLP